MSSGRNPEEKKEEKISNQITECWKTLSYYTQINITCRLFYFQGKFLNEIAPGNIDEENYKELESYQNLEGELANQARFTRVSEYTKEKEVIINQSAELYKQKLMNLFEHFYKTYNSKEIDHNRIKFENYNIGDQDTTYLTPETFAILVNGFFLLNKYDHNKISTGMIDMLDCFANKFEKHIQYYLNNRMYYYDKIEEVINCLLLYRLHRSKILYRLICNEINKENFKFFNEKLEKLKKDIKKDEEFARQELIYCFSLIKRKQKDEPSYDLHDCIEKDDGIKAKLATLEDFTPELMQWSHSLQQPFINKTKIDDRKFMTDLIGCGLIFVGAALAVGLCLITLSFLWAIPGFLVIFTGYAVYNMGVNRYYSQNTQHMQMASERGENLLSAAFAATRAKIDNVAKLDIRKNKEEKRAARLASEVPPLSPPPSPTFDLLDPTTSHRVSTSPHALHNKKPLLNKKIIDEKKSDKKSVASFSS